MCFFDAAFHPVLPSQCRYIHQLLLTDIGERLPVRQDIAVVPRLVRPRPFAGTIHQWRRPTASAEPTNTLKFHATGRRLSQGRHVDS